MPNSYSYTSSRPPQKNHWKVFVSAVLLLILTTGAVAGFLLVKRNQELRQQAFEGDGDPKKGLSIEGNKILLDGKPFIMRGVISLGLVAPKNTPDLNPYVAAARTRFGFKQMAAAKEWGANTYRFHVSEPALDPQSPLYSQEYIDEVYAKVRLALSQGFVVIVDMQAEAASGAPFWTRMPTERTKRAWTTLTPLFAEYPRVMYEVFNEPSLVEHPAHWDIWLEGGLVPASDSPTQTSLSRPNQLVAVNAADLDEGFGSENMPEFSSGNKQAGTETYPAVRAVGHQELVTHIRNQGAKNIIIVDGLFYGRTLNKEKLIQDPLNKIVYAAHVLAPFDKNPSKSRKELWDERFGDLSNTHPVLITAWSAHNFYKSACRDNAREVWSEFFPYIRQKNLGIAIWGFDIEGVLVKEITSEGKYIPNDFTNFDCNTLKSGGGGRMIQEHFKILKNQEAQFGS